ncbi:MAG: KpsF/GutQ family sugar-phosphate isomerase [Acidobacteria bacterium]|nr:KpsF/GutQ family sugar-phosphate isomerase [Acidobacteriota bacterium]MDW7984139.1 KpsF/GutQ family sugar-phosphate isomerase [Acidobacteriota bacterium]
MKTPPEAASVPLTDAEIVDAGRRVLRLEGRAISRLAQTLGPEFAEAVRRLATCRGRVLVSGVGKSGVIGKKLAGTLTSVGIPSFFLHPVEALHGDLGLVTSDDIAVLLSYSGETLELLRLLEWLHRLGVPSMAITGARDTTLARYSQVVLAVGPLREASPDGILPTTSTTVMLSMCDALAVAVMQCKGITEAVLSRLHPAGSIGRKLLRVAQVMHTGDDVPRVLLGTPLVRAVQEMSRKGFGCTVVVDADDRVVGIYTDGDLRRTLERQGSVEGLTIDVVLTPRPKTVRPDDLAVDALRLMEKFKITALVVIDEEGRLQGLVHIHDLWRLQMF